MKRGLVLIICILLVGCQNDDSLIENYKEEPSIIIESRFDSQGLDDFYQELFVDIMALNPETIDDLGDLSEYGVEFQKDQVTLNNEMYHSDMNNLLEAGLDFMSKHKLNEDEDGYIDYINVKWYLEMELDKLYYENHVFFLSQIIGDHRGFYDLLNEYHIIESVEDAESWIKRIEMTEEKASNWIEKYNLALEAGYGMDKVNIDSTIGQLRGMYSQKAEYMPLYENYEEKINSLYIEESEKTRLLEDAKVAIERYYIPSLKSLKEVLMDSMRLVGDPQGVWTQPNGEAYYLHALKKHTTTDMTPEEIHNLGLLEVERITSEITSELIALGFDGSIEDMIKTLYKEAESYSGEEALTMYKTVAAEMEQDLEQFFYEEDLPKSSPDIKVSPGGNFYMTPSIDGKRTGAYYLDLSGSHLDLNINTLAYHETVPGHHLEREHELLLDVPMIRKLSFNTAYIEGWALYAETLADENGYNPTPAHHIGYLKSELHRAARLVVDTGIHYKKWDRTQAVNYLVDYGLLSNGYAQAEVTRYFAWPGQACAYKVGQLKLIELRNKMQDAFGDQFDIKEFHHLVLTNGSMPLILLEEYVDSYIESFR